MRIKIPPDAWKIALLLLATVVVYLPAMNGGFVWDDEDSVAANVALRSADGLRRLWTEPGTVLQYYPGTYTVFWIEYQLWGLRTFGYHLVNVLLHGANAVLLALILRRLLAPALTKPQAALAGWIAAAVFALHPVQVQSVAWITELKNVLSQFFYFGTVLAYLRFMEAGRSRIRWRWYAAAVAFFAVALLTKTAGCLMPVVLLLIVWWKGNGRDWKRELLPLAPMFLLGLVGGLVTIWVEHHRTGTSGPAWDFSAVERVLIAGRVFWFYLWKLSWPASLAFNYPRWHIDAADPLPYLAPAGVVALYALLWAGRKRAGDGPLVAGLYYFAMILPVMWFVSGYLMIYSFVSDHFVYAASVGPIALVAALLAPQVQKSKFKNAWTAAVLVALTVLGALTWRQAAIYTSDESVWRDTLAKNPGSWLAHNNLASHLLDQGKPGEAAPHLERVLELHPRCEQAFNNLAAAHLLAGRTAEAVVCYQRAIEIRPSYAKAHYNLGLVLARLGRLEQAASHYRAAAQARPDYADAYNNLGNVLSAQGNANEAIVQYETALHFDPSHAIAHFNLARVLVSIGRKAEAETEFKRAVELNPALASPPSP